MKLKNFIFSAFTEFERTLYMYKTLFELAGRNTPRFFLNESTRMLLIHFFELFCSSGILCHVPLSSKCTTILEQSLVIWKPNRGTCSASDVSANPRFVSQIISVLSSAPDANNIKLCFIRENCF